MASVTSLGLHQPTALQYAIQEELLPSNPAESDYSWDITVDADDEDELLVTQDCVIWSRGNIFRKRFGFDVEKEPITQALLTYFPGTQRDHAQGLDSEDEAKRGPSSDGRHMSKALVVFLRTQAHIYFLDGTSHVVHMPFEVESACAAPQGVIIQRKQRNDGVVAASLKFPRVPPNSFISPQSSPMSMRTSQQSTFTTETLGRPKALPLRMNQNMESMWEVAGDRSDSHWPRLVSLTDPLLELGLVVNHVDPTSKSKGRRSSDRTPQFLDRAEEILSVEAVAATMHPSPINVKDKLCLAVTMNRETGLYTVWRVTYIPPSDPFRRSSKPASKKTDRRRSSMQPGQPSVPMPPGNAESKESFGAALPRKRSRKSEKQEKSDRALETLESSLGLDKDAGGNRRASRRVSSMLARADLSASQDRAAFADQPQVPNHNAGRRDTSYGSMRSRNSGTFPSASFNSNVKQSVNALGSFLEAPIDNLLEELRTGGDFEGFHSMGLDDHDFDGLTQEMLFSKIQAIPIDNTNVRYSLSNQPAKHQSSTFCLSGPSVITDAQARRQVLIGIQDRIEKRLQLLTLHVQTALKPASTLETNSAAITFGQLRKFQNVVDSIKITDGDISMILVVSGSPGGPRELSLQAPWSQLTTISLPPKLLLANVRSLDYQGSLVNREIGIRRAVTPTVVGEIAGVRHAKRHGMVDVLDSESRQFHQIRIQMRPRHPHVARIIEHLRALLPHSSGEMILLGWWHVMRWLQDQSLDAADIEWSALTITILSAFLALGTESASASFGAPTGHRRNKSLLRSSSGAMNDTSDWAAMNHFEVANSATHPIWVDRQPWQWIMEEDTTSSGIFQQLQGREDLDFLSLHVKLSHSFLASEAGKAACGDSGYLPTSAGNDQSSRIQSSQDIALLLHLISEEDKLNIASTTLQPPGSTNLGALILLLTKWLQWSQWAQSYEAGMPPDFAGIPAATWVSLSAAPPEPSIWSVFDWVQSNFTQETALKDNLPSVLPFASAAILPRIRMLSALFSRLKEKRLRSGIASPIDFVEAMASSGISTTILESFPEAVMMPLRDAIAQCQGHPPPGWSTSLLQLVDRSDAGSLLSPVETSRMRTSTSVPPSHAASWDFASLCANVMDFGDTLADDVAENDKQSVIRAIFKEDRRLEETKLMLNTTKPRAIRLDPQPEWTESFYLEHQKEVVTRLATNTLSIPLGRGLLNFGMRFPLLTQKFHINGFVLNCIVKPTNVTVGVDKNLFTEDKIAWAFFHSGVAGGLSISREAKGIDTSWILYNKPGNDLNNRHAGFLLALGLNGHLKDVAKWVAFKYLTPKHTMTSIGLLLGLAASYIGTMDSLITRLLSVHVTRMLPRGAAELNLSPLTQTTGIMGIGLLYCNSQHRRMSEIMMSEIAHVETEDEEEPLRSECYRLAAGFALGFINLGKGKDLKGLHDMRITEQLLTIASTTKKVELVHILDRSASAAVMAIALIYMKSDDHIIARKVDVPDAILQFDYVRPDILLLRTVAKHLILWSEVKATHLWIRENLPARYHPRVDPPTQPFDHPSRGPLNSTHLPFLSILAGLCFAIALRHAGSGDLRVRDLLLSYLHRFYSYCRSLSVKASFDDRTVQLTARMCLDTVSLATATVMAGTCDLKVLRILRSLHGRNHPETTYGSHMAAHMAIGVLSLGCGTQTFSTSNLAIASLLVAFYPVFPDQVQDNKSHLQAFRHFWVLATDPRCLVTKDTATNTPVSVPIVLTRKGDGKGQGKEEIRNTPCLLPPLAEVEKVRTESPEFWNLELDFAGEAGQQLKEKFAKNQTLYLRRRPAGGSPFSATMLALGRQGASELSTSSTHEDVSQSLEWLFDSAPSLQRLTHAERGVVLDRGVGGPDVGLSRGSVVDARLSLEAGVRNGNRDDLLALRGLFEWADWRAQVSEQEPKDDEVPSASWRGDGWLRDSVVEGLKGMVWLAGRDGDN